MANGFHFLGLIALEVAFKRLKQGINTRFRQLN